MHNKTMAAAWRCLQPRNRLCTPRFFSVEKIGKTRSAPPSPSPEGPWKAPGRPWKALQAVTAFSPTAQESPKTSPRRCNAPASAKEAKEQAHQKCVYLNSSNFKRHSSFFNIFHISWMEAPYDYTCCDYLRWMIYVLFFSTSRGLCHCRPQLGTLSDDATFPQRDEVEPQRKTHRVSRQ